MDEAVKNLLAIAALMRVKSGVDHTLKITMRDTRNITDLYRKRFEANYASTGQAWGNDPLWQSDFKLCKTIADGAANVR